MSTTIRIDPKLAGFFLAGAAALFTLLSLATVGLVSFVGHGGFVGSETLVQLFDTDLENNVPTWYASSTLLVAAALLGVIAVRKRTEREPYALHWAGLSVTFVALSLDEAAAIHSRASDAVRVLFGELSGVLHYEWVVVGAALVTVLGLLYLPFLFHLPRRARWQILLAGGLFVGGSLGMEMVNGVLVEANGGTGIWPRLGVLVEEALEMAGVAVFIFALLDYMERQRTDLVLRFEGKSSGTPQFSAEQTVGEELAWR